MTAAGSPKLQSLNRGTENLASPTARRILGGEHAAVMVDVRVPTTNSIENIGLSILVIGQFESTPKNNLDWSLAQLETGKSMEKFACLGGFKLVTYTSS